MLTSNGTHVTTYTRDCRLVCWSYIPIPLGNEVANSLQYQTLNNKLCPLATNAHGLHSKLPRLKEQNTISTTTELFSTNSRKRYDSREIN